MSRATFLRRMTNSSRRPDSRPTRRTRLAVEPLEDRAVPATFTVNTFADTVDSNPGDGICADASGKCSLRAAIQEANALAGDDTIILPAGTYNLTISGAGEEAAATGDLDVAANGKLTIQGAGAAATIIDAAGLGDRVFHVLAGANADISGISILNGNEFVGGGMYNAGMLTVSQCTLSANYAANGYGYGGGQGGGIYNAGTLAVSQCTLSANSSFSSGGGIENAIGGTLAVNQSTLSGNSAQFGGGIRNTGTLTVSQCTLSANSGADTGGGILNVATLTLNNSIVANSISDRDVVNAGTLTGSHNLIEDGSGGLSDTITGDPLLGPLADNGGPTKTHALLDGSPAINAGSDALAVDPHGNPLTTDQRGFARISGAHVDIGAFEVQQNSAPTLAAPASVTAFEDVDLAFADANNKITVGDPEGDTLTVTLMVGHGTLTLQTAGGQTVTGAVVTLSGSIADLNAALATLSYRGALNFAGDDWLNVTVGDGRLSTTGSVAIHVKSDSEQAADLQARVDALYAAGVLNKGQDTSLDAKLRIQDNLGDASKVQAFLDQVAALFQAGILSQDQADALLGPGRILLLSVSRR